MSKPNIQKVLAQLKPDFEEKRQISTPVLLSDNKGSCLKREVSTDLESEIKSWCKGGQKTHDAVQWLRQNIRHKVRHYGKLQLYVWLGTCDLTIKSGKFTSIRSTNNDTVDYLVSKYQEIISIVNEYRDISVTFLEIPSYSISKWNKSRCHQNPENFREDDRLLESQVELLNEHIRSLNLTTRSPKFSLDLRRNRRVNKGKKTIYYFNYELYKDGVHPCSSLAKLWLRRLTLLITKDCYST
ncbi:hypothetical protein FSP39_004254 [Pinctada imbricata]|uniref:Uncharacterized protein n=1 Tax=Pinctada imbricata TaxID=66713 RepID=A0AA88XEL6_PINIB|nr:hypothetical protein FSP39_004254 [Pinctada imbricata]